MKILSICGSPRKGNSEAILLFIQKLFKKQGIDNEIILLREKTIGRCQGCVEYCNRKFKCCLKDDMPKIMTKMEEADGFAFISPNYFQMPSGLLKDFIDRSSIFYTAGKEALFKTKKTIVLAVGTDSLKAIDVCVDNIADRFCKVIGMPVVGKKSFRSHSELKGNYHDIFQNNLNPDIEKDLKKLVKSLTTKS